MEIKRGMKNKINLLIIGIVLMIGVFGVGIKIEAQGVSPPGLSYESNNPELTSENGRKLDPTQKLTVSDMDLSFIAGAGGGNVKIIQKKDTKYFRVENVMIVTAGGITINSLGLRTSLIFDGKITEYQEPNFIKIIQDYEFDDLKIIETNDGKFKVKADKDNKPIFVLDKDGKLTTGTKFTNPAGYTLEYLDNNKLGEREFEVTRPDGKTKFKIIVSKDFSGDVKYLDSETTQDGKILPARLQIGEHIIPLENIPDEVTRLEVEQVIGAKQEEDGSYKTKEWGVMYYLDNLDENKKRAFMLPGTYLATEGEGENKKLVAKGFKGEDGKNLYLNLGDSDAGEVVYRVSTNKYEVWVGSENNKDKNQGNTEYRGIAAAPTPNQKLAKTKDERYSYSTVAIKTNDQNTESYDVWGMVEDSLNGLTMGFATPSTYVRQGNAPASGPYLKVVGTKDDGTVQLTGKAPKSRIEVISANPVEFVDEQKKVHTIAKAGDSPIKLRIQEDEVKADRNGDGNYEVVVQGTQRLVADSFDTGTSGSEGATGESNGGCCGGHVSSDVRPVVNSGTQTTTGNPQTTTQTTDGSQYFTDPRGKNRELNFRYTTSEFLTQSLAEASTMTLRVSEPANCPHCIKPQDFNYNYVTYQQARAMGYAKGMPGEFKVKKQNGRLVFTGESRIF